MSDLVMRAAELIAVAIKERVDEAGKAAWLQHSSVLAKSDSARSTAERERDSAVYDAKVWKQALDDERAAHEWTSTVLSTTRLAYDGIEAERDEARAERDALAAKLAALTPAVVVGLDAHVSCVSGVFEGRSGIVDKVYGDEVRVRCADHFTFITERKNLVATPATVEVDGFRVGDLVRWSGLMGDAAAMTGGNRWRPISGFSETKAYYEGGVRNGYPVANLTRKPVEVGDTVRIVGGNVRFVVTHIDDKGSAWGSEGARSPRSLVAVTP